MKKRHWFGFGSLVFVVMLALGCASTQDVQILDRENTRLTSQSSSMQRAIDSLKADQAALQKQQQKDVADLRKEDGTSRADLSLRVDNLRSDVQTLSAAMEEYKEFMRRPSKEIEQVRSDATSRAKSFEERLRASEDRLKMAEEKTRLLEERTRMLEERDKELEARLIKAIEDRVKALDTKIDQMASKLSAREAEASSEKRPSPTTAAALYKEAYEAYQKGDMEGSRRKFEAFLEEYPNTELSDNAQFWIGEIYFQKKDYERSILEYEKVVTKYPEGDKVPAALFKQALAFSELGDKTNARNLLRRVVDRYPTSDQADMAKKKLEALK
jgi:tol-pal system protein YbgF